MLDRGKHQLIMGKVLKDIYESNTLAPNLGFKGGTCAYFFYGLLRFSVDLDFDLIGQDIPKKQIMETLEGILKKHGTIKEKAIKRFTVFFILSYGPEGHNIKIEVNTRYSGAGIEKYYEPRDYLGIDILAASKKYLFADKLATLTKRTSIVPRDIYDTHFFLEKGWPIDGEALLLLTEEKPEKYLLKCIKTVEGYNNTHILQGLGELIDETDKEKLRANLKKDTLFLLENSLMAIKGSRK